MEFPLGSVAHDPSVEICQPHPKSSNISAIALESAGIQQTDPSLGDEVGRRRC